MSTEERAEIIARNAAQQIEVLKALQAPTAKTLAQIRQILTGTHGGITSAINR